MKLADAIDQVKEAGFAVIPAQGWVRLTEYRKELGMKANTISARLRMRRCPPYECEKGPTGRINWIRPHEKLNEFLKAHGKPRGRSANPGDA